MIAATTDNRKSNMAPKPEVLISLELW